LEHLLGNEVDLPFNLEIIQFPVKLSYAVKINKAQGQTLNHVGIDRKHQNSFTHGQLHVALSRSGCGRKPVCSSTAKK